MEEYTEYKIVVCGPGGVGKSCLTNQLIAGLFTEEYDPTIEDSYRKQVCVDGEDGVLDILDTAGQEEYSSMLDEYLRKGQGFLTVYSVTSRDSFEEVEIFRKKMLRATERSAVPLMLVANKVDLADKRVVSTEEGQELARNIGAVYIETSAKNNFNVEEAFYELVREIRRDRDAKGYKLPTGKAPDAKEENRIKKKFSAWGSVKKALTSVRGRLSSLRKGSSKSNNKDNTPPPKSSSPTPAQQPKTATVSNSPNSSSTPQGQQSPAQQHPAQTNTTPANGSTSQPAQSSNNTAAELERQRLEQQRMELELQRQRQEVERQRLELERQKMELAGRSSTAPVAAPASNSGGGDVYGAFPKNLSDLEQPWFHGSLSSPAADDLLLLNPRVGTFLIRFSSQPGHFAVSFIDESGTVQKALIRNDPDHGFCFVEPDAPYFPSLTALVTASDHVLKFPLPNPQYTQANVPDNVYGSLAEVQRRVLEEEGGVH